MKRSKGSETAIVPAERVESAILVIRGQRVMLDSDLAAIYGTSTKRLNEQVTRNAGRFPEDFVFRLSREESELLRSQFATSRRAHGGRRYVPRVFTEHGAVMLASVLNTQIAVRASVEVVRAFVQLRGLLASNADLARKIDEMEKRYDAQFKVVFDAIRELMERPDPAALPQGAEEGSKKRIGFQVRERRFAYRVRRAGKART